MIANIVDHRVHRYRWRKVRVIAEATWHDNSVADSDQAAPDQDSVDYDEVNGVSFGEAIAWGQSLPGFVTLFVYDDDQTDSETAVQS